MIGCLTFRGRQFDWFAGEVFIKIRNIGVRLYHWPERGLNLRYQHHILEIPQLSITVHMKMFICAAQWFNVVL